MRRRHFTLASLLSLLLCLGTVVLWGVSYRWAVWVLVEPPAHNSTYFCLSSDRGGFELDLGNFTDDLRPLGSGWRIDFNACDVNTMDHAFGESAMRRLWFGYHRWGEWRGVILVPNWTVACLTAIPLIAIVRRPKPQGVCKCGYSLTGNTSGTCPECGTPVPQSSRPA